MDRSVNSREKIFTTLLQSQPPGRLVDLGAGHGTFSRLAADLGWSVTAVDTRVDRFPKDARIQWKQSDVRHVDLGSYDLILCLGLFYHLTLDDQLDLIDRCVGRVMIVDTHVANGQSTFSLSEEIEVRGYRGRNFAEKTESLLASWGNDLSFWPTPDSFYRMFYEHGFPVVLAVEPWYMPDRTFFLALPGTKTSPALPISRNGGSTGVLRGTLQRAPGAAERAVRKARRGARRAVRSLANHLR
jgi:SAM-dependent methyltransferase